MDKALRLIDYLQELTRFRHKVVRDIKDYHKHLWISDIPDEKGCFTQALGNTEDIQTTWIEVRKHEEPSLPDVPEICEDWVNNSTLFQTDDLPELYSNINVQEKTENLDEYGKPIVIAKTLTLSDHPEIEKAWEKYIDEKWLPWRELHLKWESVQKVYKILFEIHLEQQKLGEEYELILGIGFLQWELPDQQQVRRHLLAAKAFLSFDAETGKITITEDEDGAKLSVELDMLDTFQPQNVESTIKETLLSADDNPWDRSSIDPMLSALTNSLAEGQGTYYPQNIEPSQRNLSTAPVVDFAPAIILRKRSMRGLEMRLEEIREWIKNGEKIPLLFEDLFEKQEKESSKDITLPPERRYIDDSTLYYPLPSNEQQRKIAEKLCISEGVIVQGPPGTGKSLTIANLICHLLANEKRVLVTAKTSRALQVLHDKLPEDIKPLCISMLGQGLEERKSLKRSVSQIHAKESEWDEHSANTRIDKLEKQLHETKSRLAKLKSQWCTIREKDAGNHTILNGKYHGTAAKIAEKLKKEEKEYGWLKDKIPLDQETPISQNDLERLKEELKVFTSDLISELDYSLPDLSRLPKQKDLAQLMQRENLLSVRLEKEGNILSSYSSQILLKADKNVIEEIVRSTGNLSNAVEKIKKRPLPWIENAVFEMLSDKDTPWKELQLASQKQLEGLREHARIIDSQKLEKPPQISVAKVLMDAKKLKQHLKDGGKIKGWFSYDKKVKPIKYLIEEVNIDSDNCSSLDALEKLIDHLSVKQTIEDIWNLWKGKAERVDRPLSIQVAEFEELQEALDSVVSLFGLLEDAKAALSNINGAHTPSWYKQEEVLNFLRMCNTVLDKISLQEMQGQIEQYVIELKDLVIQPCMHPSVQELLDAIAERNEGQFSKVLSKLYELNALKGRLRWVNEQKGILSDFIPIFAQEIFDNPNDPKWDNCVAKFEDTWNWARANSWIDDYLNKDNVPAIEDNIIKCEKDINHIIAELASEKAWKACFPMQEDHKRNLRMFQNIKIPKTGKNVLRRRKEAQKYLEGCKDVIPAWIMPLHRVYDTIIAKPDSFDVIIVDEASQCGPEALPLFFIGTKVLVVGDDKQISPMTVGIDEAQINQAIDRFLYDFQYKESFDPRMSLFKQAEVRFSCHIYLKEHFRCMPEIIRFSNILCYASEGKPLIPMRRFSATQRLEPIKCVHVSDGYREGSDSRVINKREAEKVVETIIQCCNDDQYDGKTMGVIILQGHAQDKVIEDMLLKELGAEEIENRKLICGDPYSFQGDERHVIFLSMVAAPNERIGPFVKEDDERRFNVAASRAKDQMWLFHTATLNDLGVNCLRRKLLSYLMNPYRDEFLNNVNINIDELRYKAYKVKRELGNQPKPFESWFELDVYLDIINKGYRAIPQFECAKKFIDIVVEGESGAQLAVECDGDEFHGVEQYEEDIQRQIILERVGWKFHRIRECFFKTDREKALNQLWTELKYRGIYPIDKIKDQEAHETKPEKKASQKPLQSFLFEEMEDETIVKISNIKEALELKPSVLRKVIKQSLRERPNQTAQKEAMPGFVLRKLGVISRGRPRETFCRKIKQALTNMRNNGEIQEYKTNKNKWIRLIN